MASKQRDYDQEKGEILQEVYFEVCFKSRG